MLGASPSTSAIVKPASATAPLIASNWSENGLRDMLRACSVVYTPTTAARRPNNPTTNTSIHNKPPRHRRNPNHPAAQLSISDICLLLPQMFGRGITLCHLLTSVTGGP